MLIPRTCEYIILLSKRLCRILRRGDYPSLSGQAQCNHKVFYKREAGRSGLEYIRIEVDARERLHYTADFEDGEGP